MFEDGILGFGKHWLTFPTIFWLIMDQTSSQNWQMNQLS